MSTVLSLPKKILHSRIFSFLCIKLYISGKEDSNERNPSGVSFVFVSFGNHRLCRWRYPVKKL